MSEPLQPGQPLPDFRAADQHGHVHTKADFSGRKLVLYFYPKDDTPGCTAQACNLRDHYTQLLGQGYAVLGVSADSGASHLKFAEKYSLPFPLLADTDHHMAEAFGVWQEKKNYGKTYMGIVRTTFVADENGLITDIIRKVDTQHHTDQILK